MDLCIRIHDLKPGFSDMLALRTTTLDYDSFSTHSPNFELRTNTERCTNTGPCANKELCTNTVHFKNNFLH